MIARSDIDVYLCDYLSLKNDISGECERIAEFLGITVNKDFCQNVSKSLAISSIATTRKAKYYYGGSFFRRAKLALGIAPYVNKELRLHKNHISEFRGEANYYREVLTLEEIHQIENELSNFVERFSKYFASNGTYL